MPTARKAAKAPAAKKASVAKKASPVAEPAATRKAAATSRTSAKKSPAEKSTAKKSPVKKSTTKQASPEKKASVTEAAPTSKPVETPDVPSTRRTAPTDGEPGPGPKPATKPSQFPVRQGEDPWTKAELAEVRKDLVEEIGKHRRSIELAEAELRELLADGSDGAGRDAADVGSINFERDQEMSLAAGAREMLNQTEHAQRLLDQGLYGWCENCGEPIGKGRLQVYPRATMCVTCKQRHERR